MDSGRQYSSTDLARWGLLEAVRRESAIDRLIASVPMPPPAVAEVLLRQWIQQQRLSSAEMLQSRLSQLGLAQDELQAMVMRHWRWQQWCEQHCGPQLSSYFLKRKGGLDRVSFWRLQSADADLAAELFQQLKESETSFELLAQQSSEVLHSCQVTFTPLTPLEQLPPDLAALLRVSEPGVLWSPRPAAEAGWQLLQLQQLQPAVLDAAMRELLLFELGEQAIQSAVGPKA